MLLFVLPLMATGLLQVLYNAADRLIVGRFSGDSLALAAIGASGTINAIIVNLLIGLSGGVGIAVAQYIGAKNYDSVKRTVRTSLVVAAVGGVAFMAMGLIISEPLVTVIVSKPELIPKSLLYVRLTTLGIPALALYNFGSSILRSSGDSKTPLLIGTVSGILNVLLNLVFVCLFGMSVDGVALATVISQYVSAIWVMLLFGNAANEAFRVTIWDIRPEAKFFFRIMKLGLPQGVHSFAICFVNMIYTANMNSTFPTEVISASSVAGTIDIFAFTALGCFAQAVTVFVAQNYGAGKLDRIKRSFLAALVEALVVVVLTSLVLRLAGPSLASLFINPADPMADEILAIATDAWFNYLVYFYVIHGVLSVFIGVARGVGYTASTSIIALICEGGVKLGWVLLIAPIYRESVRWFLTGHVAGWALNLIIVIPLVFIAFHRIKKELAHNPTEAELADD